MSAISSVTFVVASALTTASSLYPGPSNSNSSSGGHHVSTGLPNISTDELVDPSDNMSSHFDRWEISPAIESKVVPVVFLITFIVGLVGNGTLIISVMSNKVMCNIPNIFIVSLSFGDFLLILVSAPVTSVLYTFKSWPFGEAVCKINEFTQTVSLGVSVFTLTALSADRYVAIVNPMAKLTGRTLRTTIATVVGIWLMSILLAIPDAVMGKQISYNSNGTILVICHSFDSAMTEYSQIYVALRFLVYFVLPMLTIGFFYVMMARILIRSSSSVPVDSKTGAANHNRQMAARKKVAYVVLSFVIIFIVCWLPRHIYQMLWHFTDIPYGYFFHAFKILSFCLTFINSCVNPFALYFLSGQFRKYYNRYLFCCCRGVRYDSLEPTSTMHNLHSTSRRPSATNTSIVHSQSMC